MGTLRSLPLPLVATLGFAALMLIPALHGLSLHDEATARPYFYTSLMMFAASALVAIATAGTPTERWVRSQLLSLVGIFLLLPIVLAVPVQISASTTFMSAYVEMVSAITTTGLPVLDVDRLNETQELWRALVAWAGGFVMWTAAIAVFAPLNLGGFEVTQRGRSLSRANAASWQSVMDDLRVYGAAKDLLPIYAGLTGAFAIALIGGGRPPVEAFILASSALSTSGYVLADGGVLDGPVWEEIILFGALIFGVSRATYDQSVVDGRAHNRWLDPELRLAIVLVSSVSVLLFFRHFLGAFDTPAQANSFVSGLMALWGMVFTALSFLTTTGFVSEHWQGAQTWSGLKTSGLILMGLSLVGGGVATTAGGVKLLRIYALFKHSRREIDKLILPSAIGRRGSVDRKMRHEGAQIAWVFFMLFAVSLGVMILFLTFLDVGFEDALVLSIAALANCGPLVMAATERPIDVLTLSTAAKSTLAIAMVLGRLELLALIALFNPEFWRS